MASEGRLVPVAGAHPDHGIHRLHPDLAVADPAGLRGLHDDAHHVIGVGGLGAGGTSPTPVLARSTVTERVNA